MTIVVPKNCQNKCGCFAPCASPGDAEAVRKRLEALKKQKDKLDGQIDMVKGHLGDMDDMQKKTDKGAKAMAKKDDDDDQKEKGGSSD